MNLWTRLQWVIEFVPFAVIWSWWGLCPLLSSLGVVLSSASTTFFFVPQVPLCSARSKPQDCRSLLNSLCLARKPNIVMHMRSGACPALLGRESTARSCGWVVSEVVVGSGLEVTVKEQQGLEKHESGEGAMERYDACATNTFFFMTLEPCVYVTRIEMCEVRSERAVRRKMRVRQVSVCTPTVVHTVVATTCVRNLKKNSVEENEHASLHDHLDKKTSICRLGSVRVCTKHLKNSQTSSFHGRLVGFSSIIVSGGFSVSRGMRVWETDILNLLIFDDTSVWTFSNCVRSTEAIWASGGSSWHNLSILIGFRNSCKKCSAFEHHSFLSSSEWKTPEDLCNPRTALDTRYFGEYRRWYNTAYLSGFGNAFHEVLNSLEAIKIRHILKHLLDDFFSDGIDASVMAEHHAWEFSVCSACPCKFSSGQLLLSDGIGTKFHVYKLLSVSRGMLETSEFLCPQVFRSVTTGPFET